jgi:hypothetical protein
MVKESATQEQPLQSYASALNSSTELLRSLLDEAKNVEFAITDDSPRLIYKQQDSNIEKSVPIKVLKGRAPDEQYDLKYIKSCKVVKFAWHHETGDPLLSLQNGEIQISDPDRLKNKS